MSELPGHLGGVAEGRACVVCRRAQCSLMGVPRQRPELKTEACRSTIDG